MEQKLEELSTSDMKTFILELRPEIMQKLYNLSDDDVKAMYQAIVKQELEKDNNKLNLTQRLAQCVQDNVTNRPPQLLNRQQKYPKQLRPAQQIIQMPRQRDHKKNTTEYIRKFLMQNLPEMKKQLATFDACELQQLYMELVPTQPRQEKKKEDFNKDKGGCISSKLKVNMKAANHINEDCNDYTGNRIIRQRARKPKQQISSYSSRYEFNSNNDSACRSPQHRAKKAGIRPQKKIVLPQQNDPVDILTDEQIKSLYVQQRQLKQSSSSEALPKVNRLPLSIKDYQQSFYKKDQAENIPNVNQRREGNALQFQHIEGGKVKARTFLFVHTVYENQKNINSNNEYKLGDCQCPCCQNNTIVNLYHQLKEYFDKYK